MSRSAVQGGDVVTDPAEPSHRFMRALNRGGRWVVWYEQGGIGLSRLALGLAADRSGAMRIESLNGHRGLGYPSDLCRASQRWLAAR